jgi:hypothetical protein
LPSYGAERRPIAQMTLAEAVDNYTRLVGELKFDDILEDTPSGAEHRRVAGEAYAGESVKAWRPVGIHLGYGYPWSSVIAAEAGSYPQIDLHGYVPSTEPGFRAPHAWLADGSSTLDLFGSGFVLLRIGPDAPDVSGLVAAAEAAGMPLSVRDIDGEAVHDVYDRRLVLVRPDGHIAWRGNTEPADAGMVIDHVRGFAGGTAGGESISASTDREEIHS